MTPSLSALRPLLLSPDFGGVLSLGMMPLVTAVVTFPMCLCFDALEPLICIAGTGNLLDKTGGALVSSCRRSRSCLPTVRLWKTIAKPKRMESTVFWCEKSVAQGNTYAAYRLGKLYLEGTDVPKDTAKAVEYLTNAAQEGNQYAQ